MPHAVFQMDLADVQAPAAVPPVIGGLDILLTIPLVLVNMASEWKQIRLTCAQGGIYR